MKNEIKYNFFDNNLISQNTRNVKIPFFTYEEKDNNLNSNKKSSDKDDNRNKIPIFDLNKIFQFNFSYNFDLLKNLLETMIQNQQESQKSFLKMKKDNDLKINEIENSIIDLKIKLNSPHPKVLEELKKEKEKIQKESEIIKNKIIKEKSLEKEEKENNSHIINNLTVSNK